LTPKDFVDFSNPQNISLALGQKDKQKQKRTKNKKLAAE
jgi:hypothetical protein